MNITRCLCQSPPLHRKVTFSKLRKLKMTSQKCLVVGISGTTCSGKSSLAKELNKKVKDSILIHQDGYFLPIDDPRHTKIPELNHNNWEILTSLDMEQMHSDILKAIKSIEERKQSGRGLLIVDGFSFFEYKPILDLCDLRYFLTLTKEECWERRKTRTYDPPDVPGYFEKIVWPEHLKHKSRIMKDEDLCKTIMFIDGTRRKEEIFQMVYAEINKLLS